MIYYIGLIFVIILTLISIDDFVWDIQYFFSKKRKNNTHKLNYKELRDTIPGFLAVIVAAYNEEDVLEEVIENLIKSSHYPVSMYHIFLGVYPNDPGTMKIAKKLSEKHDNVHKIVHVLEGPSSKADNINNVIKNILRYEKERNVRFKGFVIHDSEDLVHPYEFLIENYLLNYHEAIQMPVFPLQLMPKLKNIFKNMISGTYADEFAENHYSMLVSRNTMGSFVPSAGTGFTLSREVIGSFSDSNVFPVGSLTEDYKLSLQLKEKGFNLHYALEEVERLKDDGRVVREFIATRSRFPNTYKAAVKQKTRWIYGITMESFKLEDIMKSKKLSIVSQYSLYKDWKAKFGNLLLGPGYLAFAYFIISIFFDTPFMFPKYTISWYLMIFVTIMMIQRQFLRGRAVKNVYGFKSMILSVLFPPLLPIRMVIGNIINFHATIKAWRINLFRKRVKKKKKKKKQAWDKTDHEFLDETALKGFRRTLGDILLYEELITQNELRNSLDKAKNENLRLGEILIKDNIVSEENILISLSKIRKTIYLRINKDMISRSNIEYLNNVFLIENTIAPIIETNKNIVFAISDPDKEEFIRNIVKEKEQNKENIEFIYCTKNIIEESLDKFESSNEQMEIIKNIETLIEDEYINLKEAIIILRYLDRNNDIEDILDKMGFIIKRKELGKV